MNHEVLEALGQITREKNIDRELIWETLTSGLIAAAKKRFETGDNLDVRIDETSGVMEVVAQWDVVKEVEDPETQKSLEAAREIDPDAKVGAQIEQQLPFEEFGRNAIQSVKQVVVQRVREAERENIYEKSCGSLFFFSISQRLLPKNPKNEVLVAAEPGKCPQNESQKAYVGQNWSQTDFAVVSVN